jgi:RimJ/RimL family protein N-acetyltransferase
MEKPTLQGEMIRLRPIGPLDADAFWDLVNDAEGGRLTGRSRVYTPEKVAERCSTIASRPNRIDLAVTVMGSDEMLGEIVLKRIDTYAGTADLRLVMRPAHRGRGLGTEAIGLVLGMAFEGLGLHRVGLTLLSINPRAQALYEGLGFRVEGRLREAFLDGDRRCDGIIMGLLEDEYRALAR